MMAYEMTEKLHSRKTNTPNHENILSEESVNRYFEDYHRFNVSNKGGSDFQPTCTVH